MEEATEKKPKSKARRFFGHLLSLILSLALMGMIYVAVVVLQPPGDEEMGSYVVQEEKEPLTRMQSATMSDAFALSRLFGAALPMLPNYAMTGKGANLSHDGEIARMAQIQYPGVLISAVRPASAAPLLLRENLAVSTRGDVTVLNLPAVLSARGDARCVYFVTEDAAYSVYASQASEEDFFTLLDRLAWAE